MLKKTNAGTEIVVSTMFTALKNNFGDHLDNLEIIKMIGRANIESELNLKRMMFSIVNLH